MLEIPSSVSVHFLFHEQDIEEAAKDKGRERETEVRKVWQGWGMRTGRGGSPVFWETTLPDPCTCCTPPSRLPEVVALTHRGVNNWNVGPVHSGSRFHIAALVTLTTSPAPALTLPAVISVLAKVLGARKSSRNISASVR